MAAYNNRGFDRWQDLRHQLLVLPTHRPFRFTALCVIRMSIMRRRSWDVRTGYTLSALTSKAVAMTHDP